MDLRVPPNHLQIVFEVILDAVGTPLHVQYLPLDDTACVVMDAGDVLMVALDTKLVDLYS